MARPTFEYVEELQRQLQELIDERPTTLVVRLEHDFMRDEVHAWGKCRSCRARFHRIEAGHPAPLLTVSRSLWPDAIDQPMPAMWLPVFTLASLEDKRAMEAMKAAHARLNAPARELRRHIVDMVIDAVHDSACACMRPSRSLTTHTPSKSDG